MPGVNAPDMRRIVVAGLRPSHTPPTAGLPARLWQVARLATKAPAFSPFAFSPAATLNSGEFSYILASSTT